MKERHYVLTLLKSAAGAAVEAAIVELSTIGAAVVLVDTSVGVG